MILPITKFQSECGDNQLIFVLNTALHWSHYNRGKIFSEEFMTDLLFYELLIIPWFCFLFPFFIFPQEFFLQPGKIGITLYLFQAYFSYSSD